MELSNSKKKILSQLQKEIWLLQGFKPESAGSTGSVGLGAVEKVFPNGVFPKAAIHEFIITLPENAAASGGFIAGLLNALMQKGGACLWISTSRTLFPPSLKAFGIDPERIIFIDVIHEKEVLWVMEEALKCEALAAVIAEVRDINLTGSRRLQLAVERSGITGMILRKDAQKMSTTACVARWQIRPIASEPEAGMPGVGFPRWNVELLKVRNGNPGNWEVEWSAGEFNIITESQENTLSIPERNVG